METQHFQVARFHAVMKPTSFASRFAIAMESSLLTCRQALLAWSSMRAAHDRKCSYMSWQRMQRLHMVSGSSYLHDLVVDLYIEHARHKASADALDFVRTCRRSDGQTPGHALLVLTAS
jgi:hypothetical protein